MRTVKVSDRHENKRIDRYLKEVFPALPEAFLYKALRKKDIRANGNRVRENYFVQAGDNLDIYITDNILDGAVLSNKDRLNKWFSIIYEDKNVLIVSKEPGIPVHPDWNQPSDTLVDFVKEYLMASDEYKPDVSGFDPALCHRLDRNTGGLIIIAKNRVSLEIVTDKLKSGEIKKQYQCLVRGKPDKPSGELRDYLTKIESKSRVFINKKPGPGAREIITRYSLIAYDCVNEMSLLEVDLVTGRTHQIRAHLAFAGYPIIGDGKYGSNAVNDLYRFKYQALWAYRLIFRFNEGGILSYLKGREFFSEPHFENIRLK